MGEEVRDSTKYKVDVEQVLLPLCSFHFVRSTKSTKYKVEVEQVLLPLCSVHFVRSTKRAKYKVEGEQVLLGEEVVTAAPPRFPPTLPNSSI